MSNWNFKVVGVSYKSAPISVREECVLSQEERVTLLRQLKDIYNIQEALVLSTCNRTEVYYSSDVDAKDITTLLCAIKCLKAIDSSCFYVKNQGKDALTHLCRVALGIEAQIVGETQIFHQVKAAYQLTHEVHMAGPYLHRLIHTIFYINKRVTNETNWRKGIVSVPYAAANMLNMLLKDRMHYTVLLLGLGEIGEEMCRNLSYLQGKSKVWIANRTSERARLLSKKYGYESTSFTNYIEKIQEADVIISCLNHRQALIEAKHLSTSGYLPSKYFIDLAVPRSISENVSCVPGVLLYNIDEIREETSRVQDERARALPDVERILCEELEEFHLWCEENSLSPVIQNLKDSLEALRKQEMMCYIKNASKEERERLEKITKGLVQRILKYPVLELREACKRGQAETLADILSSIFDLEKTKEKRNLF